MIVPRARSDRAQTRCYCCALAGLQRNFLNRNHQNPDNQRMRPKRTAPVIALLVVSVVAVPAALEPGLPSKTAVWAAAARALGSRNPDPKQRNPDYLAIKFLGRGNAPFFRTIRWISGRSRLIEPDDLGMRHLANSSEDIRPVRVDRRCWFRGASVCAVSESRCPQGNLESRNCNGLSMPLSVIAG
jgi:hypothetical protein